MKYLMFALAWIEIHPVFFVVVAWPIITMVVNAAFKHRTPEELDRLPAPVAGFLRFLRATGLDAKPALALIWGALTRQKVPMPELADKLPLINGDYAKMDKEEPPVVINTIQEVPKTHD